MNVTVIALGLTISVLAQGQSPVSAVKAEKLSAHRFAEAPLTFEPNLGQSDPAVRYVSRGQGYTLFLTEKEAMLGLVAKSGDQERRAGLTMEFVGGNRKPKIEPGEPLDSKSNFFLGNDPHRWRTEVPNYGRVAYRNIYPGVDVVFYGDNKQLEYDLVLGPGANPRGIRLKFDGVQRIENSDHGDLILRTSVGAIRQRKPTVYQTIGGVRREVASRYKIQGNQVQFDVAQYDPRQELVIDPILNYSVFLGGGAFDQASAVAVDSTGNAYVTGFTSSGDFPHTNGIFTALTGSLDAFVTKYDTTGHIVYSTYLGGMGSDQANGIAVDSNGNVYVTGLTASNNFPLSNALQTILRGARNAFVTKINNTGSALVYSTYLGGTSFDQGQGIAADSNGNAYVVGYTSSQDFASTIMPQQTAIYPSNAGQPGTFDAFVAKINSTGSQLIYATYLGGTSIDQGFGIALDSASPPNVYVTGFTSSSDFKVMNSLQAFGGTSNAFVTEINGAGTALVFSTYLGGTSQSSQEFDQGNSIAVDGSNNVLVTGFTTSASFPTTNGLYTSLKGSQSAFVTKINAAHNGLVYSTYLGGNTKAAQSSSAVTVGVTIAVDGGGNAFATGNTTTTDFPTTAGALQSTFVGAQDVYVSRFDPTGATLGFSTFLGGAGGMSGVGMNAAGGVAVDIKNNVDVAGFTNASDFPNMSNAYSQGGDAFVLSLSEGLQPPQNVSVNPNTGSGTSQQFTFTWADPNGGIADIQYASVIFNASFSTQNGCYLVINVPNRTINLANDAGTAFTQLTVGSAGTIQNSQCTVNGAGSTLTGSGNNMTFVVNISFNLSFAGLKQTFMWVQDLEGMPDSAIWQDLGNWTVPSVGNQPPQNVSVSPSSGTGASQQFTFTWADPNGGIADIQYASVIFNASFSTQNGCYLVINVPNRTINLANDAGTAFTQLTVGSAGTIQNSQCTVNGAGSTLTGSGNNMTFVVNITFNSSFAGLKQTFMWVQDLEGMPDSAIWQDLGNWTVPAGSNQPPQNVSVSPNTGSGFAQQFTFTWSDPNGGIADIQYGSVIFNASFSTQNGCYLVINVPNRTINLANNTGNAFSQLSIGSGGTIQNSQCTVNGAGSTLTGSGNNMTFVVNISFNLSFAGLKQTFMWVQDNEGVPDSAIWQDLGNWTVSGGNNQPPQNVSVSPASGTGATQQFTFTWSDPNGGIADIQYGSVIFNAAFSTQNGCYFVLNVPNQTISLANDAGNAFSQLTIGSATSIQNTQCTVNGTGSTLTGSGNNMTLVVTITFNHSFAGLKQTFMWVQDNEGVPDSAIWQDLGNWMVP